MLLAAVVGSGIMGDRLAAGNVAVALLANTIATGAALVALILTFGPISGAHFNPAVTVADASQGGTRWSDVPTYIGAQIVGAFVGVFVAHLMFEEQVLQVSTHVRSGGSQVLSECIATFGLLAVIWGCSRARSPSRSRLASACTSQQCMVYGVDIVCKPGGDHRQSDDGYIRWNPTIRRARVHRGPDCWRGIGNAALPMVASATAHAGLGNPA